jgi:hypothetical protein
MEHNRRVVFEDSLCHRCVHLRTITSGKGSTFLMCREPHLPKYPPQPVKACQGFSPAGNPAPR